MATDPTRPVRTSLARRRDVLPIGAVLVCVALVTACGDRSGTTLADPVFPPPAITTTTTTTPDLPAPTAAPAPMVLVAPWVDDAEIADRHTCRDLGVPPALSWANIPPGTVELALTVTDLDRDDYVHWIVYGIPLSETGTTEGAPPFGSFEWAGSSGTSGWEPPCPPPGETHRYRFTIHALNQQLEAADDAPAREVISIIDSTTIDRASTLGRVTGS